MGIFSLLQMAKEWEKNLTIWSHWVVYYVTFRFWLNAVPMSLSKSLAFHFLTQSSRSKQESIINAKRHILRSVNSRRYRLANCLAIVRATCDTYLSFFVFDDFFVCLFDERFSCVFTAANMNKFLIVVLFNEFEFCLKVDYWIVKLNCRSSNAFKAKCFLSSVRLF